MSNDQLKIYVPAIILAVLAFTLAYQFVDPAPPSSLTFSAGQKGGAYYANAERYRDFLQQRGIAVEVLESAGSMENIQRLKANTADIAFVQSGLVSAKQTTLLSLGSMYFEPLWVFVRHDLDVHFLRDLKGKRIATGMVGSGTRALAMRLLRDNGIDEHSASLKSMASADAARALQHAEVDAVFIVSAASNETVQALQHAEVDAVFIVSAASNETVQALQQSSDIRLLNIARAEAYTRRIDSLSAIQLPQGALDLARNIPAEDVTMLASTATLVVNKNLHPALQDMIMQATAAIHAEHSLFAAAGTFPTSRFTGMDLSGEAARFYKSGPPFLQRFLPFWAATLVDRLKVMLLPFIALLIPLFKVLPPLYRWRIRSRIYRWYEELGNIDTALDDGFNESLLTDLERIETEIRKVHVPLSYAEELYDLRLHLALVREQVEKKKDIYEQS